MVEVDVLLYASCQFKTVHFRHHHVAYHEVGLLLEYYVKRLFAVGARVYLVVGRQLVSHVVANLFVIFDHQYAFAHLYLHVVVVGFIDVGHEYHVGCVLGH